MARAHRFAFQSSHTRFAHHLPALRRTLRRVLPHLTERPVALGVFLVSDAEMRALNRASRGKDKPTNVLSFEEPSRMPHPELPKGTRVLGEIVLAPDLVARKGEDLAELLVHGLLHLFGYTHGTARDRIEMETKEDELHGLYDNRIGRRFEHGARRGRRRAA